MEEVIPGLSGGSKSRLSRRHIEILITPPVVTVCLCVITCAITTSCTLLPWEYPSVDLMVAFQFGSMSSLAQLWVQHTREQRQHRCEVNQEWKCQKRAGSRDACDCVTTKFTLGISATPHRDLRNTETNAQLCSIQIMMVKFLFTAVNTAVTHYASRSSNGNWWKGKSTHYSTTILVGSVMIAMV